MSRMKALKVDWISAYDMREDREYHSFRVVVAVDFKGAFVNDAKQLLTEALRELPIKFPKKPRQVMR